MSRRMVGRRVEIAVLEKERRRAAAGEFRVVLLLADPGIGKTHLARELLRRHRPRMLGLSARASPLGDVESFAVWTEALEEYLRTLTADEVSALCRGYLDDLAALLHTVAAARGSPPRREPSRGRLLRGLAALLSTLSAESPVAVFLDDVHTADASSWQALGQLGQTIRGARLLVLAAARPAELAESAIGSDVLLDLEQEGLLRRLHLAPLDPDALRDLAQEELGELPPAALVSWLEEHSRGNPLFALGLLRALLDEGADLAAPELTKLPESLAERVESRVRKLDEPSVTTLQSLAVLEGRVEARELAATSGSSPAALAGSLETLVHSRLVTEEERAGQLSYELAHPLVQEAIYQQMSGVRRRALHRAAGRALRAAGRPGAAASHFARSADQGDDEAIAAIEVALRQAEQRNAYREALSMLDSLVKLIPPGDARWLDVLDAMSLGAEWVVDHRADTDALLGLEAMRTLDSVLRTADPAARAAMKFRLASFLGWGVGALDEGEQACREARDLFESVGDTGSRLLAQNELAWNQGHRGNYDAMAAASADVAAEALEAGERFAALQAVFAGGHAAFARGRFAEAETKFRESVELARLEKKHYRASVGLTTLSCSLAAEGRGDEALAVLDEAKLQDPSWRDGLLPEWESVVHWFGGDFPAALASAQDSSARSPGALSKRLALGVTFASLAAAEAGEDVDAERYARRARGAFDAGPWLFLAALSRLPNAFIERQRDARDALDTLREVADSLVAVEALPFATLALLELAEAASERGEAGVAAEAAADAKRLAAVIGHPLYQALAELASAAAALARGEERECASAARRADELLAGTSCRALRARALAVLGHGLVGSDPSGAIDALTRAAAAFDACGAIWRRERARRALRSLGGRGRRAAVRGTGELSPREREVARLAAEGLTAREIGDRLFISRRTVETHLANVYAKLGVASKLELIRRADELALRR